MSRKKLFLLSSMLFVLPVMLYFSNEHLLGQLLFFSQLVVLWGLLPFIFRNERSVPREWSRNARIVTLIVVAAVIMPFLIQLGARGNLESTDILKSSVKIFSEGSEALLVLGTSLATFFVIAVLVKRRGTET